MVVVATVATFVLVAVVVYRYGMALFAPKPERFGGGIVDGFVFTSTVDLEGVIVEGNTLTGEAAAEVIAANPKWAERIREPKARFGGGVIVTDNVLDTSVGIDPSQFQIREPKARFSPR